MGNNRADNLSVRLAANKHAQLKPNPIREYIASRDNEPFEVAANLVDWCLYEPFKGIHWVVACPGVAMLLLLGGPFWTTKILSPKNAFDF